MSGRVGFWFELASTYSYPAAMTVEAEAARRGVAVAWRPFLLGPIFAELGWRDSPFTLQPAKGRYMWRDMERLCARLGLPFRRPEIFPQHSLRAARVALLGAGRGWGPAFVRAAYTANFAEGRDLSDPAVLADLVDSAGADATAVLAEAGSDPVKAALRAQTQEAARRGIFGAPSFTVGRELYWGQDRMAAALDHAAEGGP